MSDDVTRSIRVSYDQLADEYARRIFNELYCKPLDRELLDRFAGEVSGHSEICDMGCGPGRVARYLRDAGTTVFGLNLSPKMLEQARQFNPDIPFREGNMLALAYDVLTERTVQRPIFNESRSWEKSVTVNASQPSVVTFLISTK